jgi:hypothetical protein
VRVVVVGGDQGAGLVRGQADRDGLIGGHGRPADRGDPVAGDQVLVEAFLLLYTGSTSSVLSMARICSRRSESTA